MPIANGLGLPGNNAEPLDPRYIRTTDIASPTTLKDDTFVSQPADIARKASVKYGDLLLVSAGASIGKSVLYMSHNPACYAGFLTRVRPKSIREGRFLSYWTQSLHFIDQVRSTAVQSTIENFSASRYKELRVPVISEVQQERIAEYLDVETAKIDLLITKQQELIDLTKERADADIEASIWGQRIETDQESEIIKRSYYPRNISSLALERRLATLPKTWDVQRFKWVFTRKDERNTDLVLEMLSLRQTGAVVPRSETRQSQEPSEASIPKYLAVSSGDLVVNPMWLTGGAIGVSERAGAVSPDYRVFAIADQLLPSYAHEILRSVSYRHQSKLFERASTTFDRRIQQIDLDNLPVPIPPKEDQEEIVQEVRKIHKHRDELINIVERHIELAQERRSALITAAVTGQIEV
ncbi:restriction endonuclease subunit S [Actinotignum timonense]|uniref:restriction endonuclease subunit S n=1 Tax=Actinotignum timonense TaxID=1870995 RepID=UPI002A8130F0|nr:restriction endonuclease subunit S [Actinotignum timonense]